MVDSSGKPAKDIFTEMLQLQTEATQAMFGYFSQFMPVSSPPEPPEPGPEPGLAPDEAGEFADWTSVAQRLQGLWLDFQSDEW